MKYKINFINNSYRRFYKAHKKEINHAIQKCLKNGELTLREEVVKLEKTLAKYIGVKYAVGVNSGTDALFLSLKALGIGKGDEVITVSHTFIASLQAIVHCGAIPVLVDVGEDELIDVSKIEEAITSKTKAIMPVHLTGKVCDMAAITQIASKHGLYVVEDACQALGAEIDGERAGSWGDTGCFSFNTAKLLGAYGDGGAVVTNSPVIYQRLCLLRNHWNMSQLSVRKEDFPQPDVVYWGWKSRLDNIQAAVLNVKFKYLKQILKRRHNIAYMYRDGLAGLPLHLPIKQHGRVHQEFIIRTPDRGKLKKHLAKHGVEVLIRDTTPNHKLKYLGLEHFNLPLTEQMATDIMRLPIYPEMTNQEVKNVIKAVKLFYAKKDTNNRNSRVNRK